MPSQTANNEPPEELVPTTEMAAAQTVNAEASSASFGGSSWGAGKSTEDGSKVRGVQAYIEFRE